jgi:hypothetical protein
VNNMPAAVVQHPGDHAVSIASEFLGQSDGNPMGGKPYARSIIVL